MLMTRIPDPRSSLRPALLALTVGLAVWAALFWTECQAAISVWSTSTAYGHCYLVIPMSLYLAWERRAALVGLGARPTPALALLAVPVAAAWLLAERLGIMEGRQLAAIAGAEVLALTVLGWPLARALAAPLGFLVFLVPFGAFFTPWLQSVTARITEIGLTVLHIPHYVDDLIIEIPEGTFFVAEACAGLRFLIAAVAFGVFFALLNYRSPGRRVGFIIASVVIPIFANGLRALGIVVLGHILGSAEAGAADHLIYGWVFFSFVMLVLVAAGMPFRQAPAAPRAVAIGMPVGAGSAPLAAALVMALVALGPAVALGFNRLVVAPNVAEIPALAWPDGCAATGDTPAPAMRTQTATCNGLAVTMVTQAFPTRARSDAILHERRNRTGEDQAEDSSVHAMSDAAPWLTVRTTDPNRVSAVATWVDAAPAQGGIRGRIQQARDSVFGTSHAPLLITISVSLVARPLTSELTRIDGILAAIVTSQQKLDAWVERVTRVR